MEKLENIGVRKKEKSHEKSEIRKKVEGKIRLMTAWGIISLTSLGILALKVEEGRRKEYKPENVIIKIEKDKPISIMERIQLKKKLDYLAKNFSGHIFPQLQQSVEKNEQLKPQSININGFENIGISNQDLQKIWSEKYYPKGWIDEEVDLVEYAGETSKNYQEPDYNNNKNISYDGTEEEGSNGKSKIKFYSKGLKEYNSKKDLIETLDWCFGHELGHANDWESKLQMDFKNRVDFLHEVSQNCFREGAFRDLLGYINSIKNDDKNKENYYKVREYWGSCCEYYFTFPEFLKEKYPAEFAMVDKYVKMEDSNFNPFIKHNQRVEVIAEMAEK